jgi:hypothetical protein
MIIWTSVNGSFGTEVLDALRDYYMVWDVPFHEIDYNTPDFFYRNGDSCLFLTPLNGEWDRPETLAVYNKDWQWQWTLVHNEYIIACGIEKTLRAAKRKISSTYKRLLCWD